VTSYGRAYTTAVTRGTMPFGTYEVTASVAGVTRTTEWAVFGPGHTTAADYATTVAPFAAGHPVSMPRPRRIDHLCDSQDTIAAMPTPNDMDLNVSVICPDTRANKVIRGAVLATMGRNLGLRLIGMMHTEPGGVIAGNFRFNVCSLPQGTDLPGARLGITTIVYYLGDTRDFTFVAGLPADLHGPDVAISSSVPAGTPVHPGEKIKLRVTATEPDRLGPQSGIGNVKVFAERTDRLQHAPRRPGPGYHLHGAERGSEGDHSDGTDEQHPWLDRHDAHQLPVCRLTGIGRACGRCCRITRTGRAPCRDQSSRCSC
jgi:hypothetical protein